MKVYVVTSGCYSEYGIEAVFVDKKNAEIFCALYNQKHYYDDSRIEEYETDEVQVESNEEPKHTWVFRVLKKRLEYFCDYLTFEDKNKIEYDDRYYGKPLLCHITIGTDATEEEALKIASDRVAQWKYEQEGGVKDGKKS